MFTLTHQHLAWLLALNDFPAPAGDALILFGLRGCRPVDPDDQRFAPAQRLEVVEVDHQHPRCTLLQWRPGAGELAVYPGSTTPHVSYMREALPAGGQGANELLTGYYSDLRKGVHKAGTPTAHDALVQTAPREYRRTANDLDYGPDDPVEAGIPHDNLHAAWTGSVDAPHFASAGCQVVVGYPQCPKRGALPAAGPWAAFKAAAYSVPQASFPYALFLGVEAQRLAVAGPTGRRRLRFGSRGPRVEELQNALKVRGFYPGVPDGVFGTETVRAVMEAQTQVLGPLADDGVVGLSTARALGISRVLDD